MVDPVELPVMIEPQRQAWHALMDLYERLDSDWTLIGGQLVHLHCAERGVAPPRPTNDVDTVINVRASPMMLETFTRALHDMGFRPETSADGVQHRWRQNAAQIDVLVPEGVGEHSRVRTGVGGAPTISAPGTSQALARTEAVPVVLGGRVGTVLRPNLVAALIAKAAARTEVAADRASARHCNDFVVLASLISARDFRDTELTRKDRTRLRRMVTVCRRDEDSLTVSAGIDALDRLERASRLTT